MKERPILFSGPMVQAILDGRKTQTRRVVKPQPNEFGLSMWPDGSKWHAVEGYPVKCPYGQVGDRLRVKEAFWTNGKKPTESDFVIYDLEHQAGRREVCKTREGEIYSAGFIGEFKRRPSIFLPKWASRITLEITQIRVERLQEISEEDAKAEGVTIKQDARIAAHVAKDTPAHMEYWHLWGKINGPDSWAKNPWVWVIEFRRIKP